MKTAQRLFVEAPLSAGARLELEPGQAHYLASVLRLAPGAPVLAFNGRDGEWEAPVVELSRRAGVLACARQLRPQDTVPDLTLAFAPIKGDRLEAIAEKATELGAARLVPVITDRTIVRKVNVRRLAATSVEAAEQTGRLSVPALEEAVPLDRFLAGFASSGTTLVFADEAGEAVPIASALPGRAGPVTLLTGPEGGFTLSERTRIRALACTVPVTLGPRILRADTAAFAGLALIQSVWGDWGSGPG
jgi:16S rRNA (uracil1498-N3)-methyltransferase